jgi:hypothetical protein
MRVRAVLRRDHLWEQRVPESSHHVVAENQSVYLTDRPNRRTRHRVDNRQSHPIRRRVEAAKSLTEFLLSRS